MKKVIGLAVVCGLIGFLAWNGNLWLAFFSILAIQLVAEADFN